MVVLAGTGHTQADLITVCEEIFFLISKYTDLHAWTAKPTNADDSVTTCSSSSSLFVQIKIHDAIREHDKT